MMKCGKEERNNTEQALLLTIRTCYSAISQPSAAVKEAFGWFLYRYLSDKLPVIPSLQARSILSEFLKLNTERPSRLYSSFLSLAAKMATQFQDFRFISFLRIWNLSNLLPEDKESHTDESGKRFPSLTDRIAKAISYSALFHPEDELDEEMQAYNTRTYQVLPLLATQLQTVEAQNRKMYFVRLVSPQGLELSTEVHTLTNFQKLSYKDIPGTLFSCLLRKTDDGHNKLDAAITSSALLTELFPTTTGYVEHIDLQHDHVHVYDNVSRHLVAINSKIRPSVGSYVQFIPLVPKESNFKTAIIIKVLPPQDGPVSFGLRKARITYTDQVKGYCSWELLPQDDGTTKPIVEASTTSPSFTTGFLSQQTLQSQGVEIPKPGAIVHLAVFLKRGKDKQKRPYVVYYK